MLTFICKNISEGPKAVLEGNLCSGIVDSAFVYSEFTQPYVRLKVETANKNESLEFKDHVLAAEL